jgi:hypothetical protein
MCVLDGSFVCRLPCTTVNIVKTYLKNKNIICIYFHAKVNPRSTYEIYIDKILINTLLIDTNNH